MGGRFEVNNSSEEPIEDKKTKVNESTHLKLICQSMQSQSQSISKLVVKKKLLLEMTSTLTDSAWGATHQSLKWSNLRMQQVDSAWIGKSKKCWKKKQLVHVVKLEFNFRIPQRSL